MNFQNLIYEKLDDMNIIKEESNNLKIKAIYGPSRITKLPKELTPEICCFVGIIIGDGHLRKDKKRINLELADKGLLTNTIKLIKHIFDIDLNIKRKNDKRLNRKQRYYFNLDNATIHNVLTRIFDVPSGKKSDIVRVPEIIVQSSKENKKALLKGLFITDGGKRHKSFGLSSSSKELRDGISRLLNELGIKHALDQWVYKRFKKEYYGLYFNKEYLRIMRECRSGQTGQILNVLQTYLEGKA